MRLLPKKLKRESKIKIAELKDEIKIRLARKNILPFTTYTKKDYIINWHHRRICEALDRWISGEIKRLMIFMPPQYGKSELATRRLSAYIMGLFPKEHLALGTYSSDLAVKMNRDVQRIIDSDAYKRVFPDVKLSESNVRSASGGVLRNSDIFEIVNHMGSFKSVGRGQGFSGLPAHRLILDDILKDAKEADSFVIRESAWDWVNTVAMSRLQKNGSVLYIGTRWHEDEPAGRFLELQKKNPKADQWSVVSFPAIAEDEPSDCPVLFEDPRSVGEALWPYKESSGELETVKIRNGSMRFSALYQQRPSSVAGNIIARSWFNQVKVLPAKYDELIIVADMAQTANDSSDYCSFQCWGKVGANTYLIGLFRKQMELPEAIREFKTFCATHPKVRRKLVETKSNGHALISSVKNIVSGVIGFSPDKFGSKVQRVKATSPHVEAGNVYVLEEDSHTWVREFLDEICRFPKAKHDDQVDTFSMAHLYWFGDAPEVGEWIEDTDNLGHDNTIIDFDRRNDDLW